MAPEKRVEHIVALRPDICTLDLNTMNSGKEVVINTPGNVRRMAKVIDDAGVKPEIELFDSGDIALMHDLLAGRHPAGTAAVFLRDGRPLRLPARARDGPVCARSCFRTTRNSRRSASARPRSPPLRSPIWPAAMCASAWRTPSISPADSLRPPTPRWSAKPGGSSRISAARSRPSRKPDASSDCRESHVHDAHGAGEHVMKTHNQRPRNAMRVFEADMRALQRQGRRRGFDRSRSSKSACSHAERRRGRRRDQGGGRQSIRRQGGDRPDALCGVSAHAGPRFRGPRRRWSAGMDRQGSVRYVRRSRHPARRHACHRTLSSRRRRWSKSRAAMSMDEAAGIGVPFVTAIEGFRRAGYAEAPRERPGLRRQRQGRTGRSATRDLVRRQRDRRCAQGRTLRRACQCARSRSSMRQPADVAKQVTALTDGKGADIVFNTVGDPYFDDAHRSLAKAGRQILIAAVRRTVEVQHSGVLPRPSHLCRHRYAGLLVRRERRTSCAACCTGFAERRLRPFPISQSSVFPLSRAGSAYAAVAASSRRSHHPPSRRKVMQ